MLEKRKRHDNVLLSLILLTGTLLMASLLSLGVRIVAADAGAEAGEKTVYFTFDDGPSPNTEALLDLCGREGIKATFFVCAQYEDQEYAKALLRRMRDEGHTIALHTYTHDYADVYTNLEGYLRDLARIDEFVFEATGVRADLLRFPGGSATRNCDPALMKEIIGAVSERGYRYCDWTVVSGDDGPTAIPPETIAANILEGIGGKTHEIILCHDNATPATTPAAVERTLQSLREQGYQFDRITGDTPMVHFVQGD